MAAQASVPPVDKLPLVVRKNIRDEWETKVAGMEKSISDLLGETYKLEVNFNQFYAYAVAADADWCKTSPGTAAAAYFAGFIDNLKRFTEEGSYTDGIKGFNELVTERKITLEADSSFTYGGSTFKNGVFEINFNPTCPGTNTDYACAEISKSFDKALAANNADALPLIARRSLKDDFEAKEAALLAKFKDQLLGAEVTLHADYDAIWKEISAAHKVAKSDVDIDYATTAFGRIVFNYFDGLCSQIEYQFKKDDMMVEGFTEAVPTKEIWLEVAPHGTAITGYNDTLLRDDKLILRTVPSKFGTNTHYAGEKLQDLL